MPLEAIFKGAKEITCFFLALTIIAHCGCLSESPINEMKTKGDIQGLTAALNDSNKDVRSQAARALGTLMAGKGQREDPNLEFASYGTNKKNVDPSLELSLNSLIKALNDLDQDVRIEAIKALGKIGDRRAVDLLIQALGVNNPSIRATAAEALGNIGLKTKAALPLYAALKDIDPEVKSNAEMALEKMGLEPYPAPKTGTYLLGERFAGQFEGWVCTVNNTGPYNAIYQISHPGGSPHVAVFVRSGDSYHIEDIPPGDELSISYGENWDNDQKMFTKNVHKVDLGEIKAVRRSTQRYEW